MIIRIRRMKIIWRHKPHRRSHTIYLKLPACQLVHWYAVPLNHSRHPDWNESKHVSSLLLCHSCNSWIVLIVLASISVFIVHPKNCEILPIIDLQHVQESNDADGADLYYLKMNLSKLQSSRFLKHSAVCSSSSLLQISRQRIRMDQWTRQTSSKSLAFFQQFFNFFTLHSKNCIQSRKQKCAWYMKMFPACIHFLVDSFIGFLHQALFLFLIDSALWRISIKNDNIHAESIRTVLF